ncbi:exodeoxyribonuclease VII large subunit [Candidatus Uhrbacteria bacterium]|nr:exodeoxyribonuclease VII large subunit [Candidatus Uhrbacteria bacterium]
MGPFTVSQFVEFLNVALETAVFPSGAAVEGEVTEYRVSQGKWVWFGLKDDSATVWCFATVWGLRHPLEDGMTVRAYGYPKVYPKSGRFSLNVERVEGVGEGTLRRSFDLLRARLESEGIFSPERKRSLPRFPSRIGLIASSESAAYGDFLKVMNNRWGGVTVDLADVPVQGGDAVRRIVEAFGFFNRQGHREDLVALVRGGGSMEDLQAFNSEDVCRAVFGCAVPVVVGVGHERDLTLADMAADLRASTPSNAAELIFPDRSETGATVDSAVTVMEMAIGGAVRAGREGLGHCLADMESFFLKPSAAVSGMGRNLASGMDRLLSSARIGLDFRRRFLSGVDPHRLLRQGYAIARCRGRVVRSADQAKIGDEVKIQLSKGELVAGIKSKRRYA